MATSPTAPSAVPDFPALSDRVNYNAKAYAWAVHMDVTYGTEMLALATNTYDNAVEAADSASTATTQAGTATTQAGNAAASASTASTQAGIATTKASDAAQSLVDMLALYDQFDDRYLGAKASDPTLDNDGNALADGAIYVNITPVPAVLRVYSVAGGWVQGISSVAGVSSLNDLTGPLTLKTIDGQALTGAGNITTGLVREEVIGTTETAVTGFDYWATNVAATTLTAPASVDGAEFAFTPTNGLMTNTIDFGAATVRGPAGTASGVITLTLGLRMHCKYSSTLAQWVML